MGKTVKEILAEIKIEEEQQRAERQRQWELQRQRDIQELAGVKSEITKAIAGFEYVLCEDSFGFEYFKLDFKGKNVFVLYKYENQKIKYSDDSPPEDVRSLCIYVGYWADEYRCSFKTNPEQFAESFAKWLLKEGLLCL